MLISENKLRRIIRQEIIKENKRLNESKGLLNKSLMMLMMVCGATGISPAEAQKTVEGPKKSLAQCVKELGESPQKDTEMVAGTLKLAEEVLDNKDSSPEAIAMTTTTCQLVLRAAGTLSKPGIKLPK